MDRSYANAVVHLHLQIASVKALDHNDYELLEKRQLESQMSGSRIKVYHYARYISIFNYAESV